jgi:hypothetical protein
MNNFLFSTINWPVTTDLFLVGILVVGLIYEAIVVIATKDGDSISWQIWTGAQRYPFLAFLAGFLCGHLFWQMST